MATHYQRKVERNKLSRQLKSLGCPYWPDPVSPQAQAWLQGQREAIRFVSEREL